MLNNPGMGFTTFGCTAGDSWGAKPPDYPVCSVAYERWYWSDIEPSDGQINYALIDSFLARARASGQRVAFRIMAAGEDEVGSDGRCKLCVPQWLLNKGARGIWHRPYGNASSPEKYFPFFDDAIFIQYANRLIRALGTRYDGHPDLDHLDIGMVGEWGEWHMAEARDIPTLYPWPMDLSIRKIYVDMHRQAFPNTRLIGLIDDPDALRYAVSLGAGWRADCLEDEWHQDWYYPQNAAAAGVLDTWKTAPVAFEVCAPFQYLNAADLQASLDYALAQHASIVNNKSDPIPAAQWPAVNAFLKRLGYRLVLTQATFPSVWLRGDTVQVRASWVNRGVAPVYRPMLFSWRLRGAGTAHALSNYEPMTYQPGAQADVADAFLVPTDLAPGSYPLDVGAVDGNGMTVNLPLSGRTADGWYAIGQVTIR